MTWADWAIDLLGGVRGGGKTRASFGHYGELGTSDSWYVMGNFLAPTACGIPWFQRTRAFCPTVTAPCTPDYVLGSLLIDPAPGSVLRLDPALEFPDDDLVHDFR